MTLFKASEQLEEEQVAKDLGWGALTAGSLTVQEIPGDHFTLVREPNVQVLAEQLKNHLHTPAPAVSCNTFDVK